MLGYSKPILLLSKFASSSQKLQNFINLFEICKIIWLIWKLIWNLLIPFSSISNLCKKSDFKLTTTL